MQYQSKIYAYKYGYTSGIWIWLVAIQYPFEAAYV